MSVSSSANIAVLRSAGVNPDLGLRAGSDDAAGFVEAHRRRLEAPPEGGGAVFRDGDDAAVDGDGAVGLHGDQEVVVEIEEAAVLVKSAEEFSLVLEQAVAVENEVRFAVAEAAELVQREERRAAWGDGRYGCGERRRGGVGGRRWGRQVAQPHARAAARRVAAQASAWSSVEQEGEARMEPIPGVGAFLSSFAVSSQVAWGERVRGLGPRVSASGPSRVRQQADGWRL